MSSITATIQPQVDVNINLRSIHGSNRSGENQLMANTVGTLIKEALFRMGKTQAWLAEQVGVSDNAVSKWIKTGQIARENIPRTARLLGLYPDELLEAEDDPQPPQERRANTKSAYSYLFDKQNAVHLSSTMDAVIGVPLYKWSELKQVNTAMSEDPDRPSVPISNKRANPGAYAIELETSPFPSRIPPNSTIVVNPTNDWVSGKIAVVLVDDAYVLRRLDMDGDRRVLIEHESAPWQKIPFDERSRIVGIVSCIIIDG